MCLVLFFIFAVVLTRSTLWIKILRCLVSCCVCAVKLSEFRCCCFPFMCHISYLPPFFSLALSLFSDKCAQHMHQTNYEEKYNELIICSVCVDIFFYFYYYYCTRVCSLVVVQFLVEIGWNGMTVDCGRARRNIIGTIFFIFMCVQFAICALCRWN